MPERFEIYIIVYKRRCINTLRFLSLQQTTISLWVVDGIDDVVGRQQTELPLGGTCVNVGAGASAVLTRSYIGDFIGNK